MTNFLRSDGFSFGHDMSLMKLNVSQKRKALSVG
jgi:hypothetical protein